MNKTSAQRKPRAKAGRKPDLSDKLKKLSIKVGRLERLSRSQQERKVKAPRVIRIVRWFDRNTDKIVGSAPLRGISLESLQRMFGIDRKDPMYDCSPITESQATQLQAFLDVPLQLDRYDYFVEADAI